MVYLPVIVIVCAVAGSFAWWLILLNRRELRRELWPAFRFRPVLWGALDVLGAFFVVLLLAGLPWDQWLLGRDASLRNAFRAPGEASHSVSSRMDAELLSEGLPAGADSSAQEQDSGLTDSEAPGWPQSESERKRSHGLWLLLQDRPSAGTLFLCFLVAVVAAPLMEETLFRLLFQGWLATCELRLRELQRADLVAGQDAAILRIPRPRWFGAFSVVVVAACFSLIHIRSTADVPSADDIFAVLLRQLCGYGVALPLLAAWLTWGRGVPLRTWGLARKTFWPDLRLGLRWFATLAVPIYGLQVGLSAMTPDSVVVDPLTLFPFGLVSGVLCLRTGRLLPAIIFHMALNGTSLALAAILLLSRTFS